MQIISGFGSLNYFISLRSGIRIRGYGQRQYFIVQWEVFFFRPAYYGYADDTRYQQDKCTTEIFDIGRQIINQGIFGQPPWGSRIRFGIGYYGNLLGFGYFCRRPDCGWESYIASFGLSASAVTGRGGLLNRAPEVSPD